MEEPELTNHSQARGPSLEAIEARGGRCARPSSHPPGYPAAWGRHQPGMVPTLVNRRSLVSIFGKPTHSASFGDRATGGSTATHSASFGDRASGGAVQVSGASFGQKASGSSTATHAASFGERVCGNSTSVYSKD